MGNKRCLHYNGPLQCVLDNKHPGNLHRDKNDFTWKTTNTDFPAKSSETFAHFTWRKRWNFEAPDKAVASFSQDGDKYMIVTCMGVVYCDREDLEYIRRQLNGAAKMIENALGN